MGIIYNESDLKNACEKIYGWTLNNEKIYVKEGYGGIYIRRKFISIHRILGEYYFGTLASLHIHHKDHDRLNNLKSNLQKVTPSEHTKKYHRDISSYRSKESIEKTVMIMAEKRKRNDVSAKVVKKLKESGCTYTEIAKKLDCGYNTVWRRLKQLDWSEDE